MKSFLRCKIKEVTTVVVMKVWVHQKDQHLLKHLLRLKLILSGLKNKSNIVQHNYFESNMFVSCVTPFVRQYFYPTLYLHLLYIFTVRNTNTQSFIIIIRQYFKKKKNESYILSWIISFYTSM